ncbi:MAG TPA: GEVED domain-containing protein, partial [Edaphocola sp.]|nr:GEVED domain-containing protein [Edaphocola sp.]
MVIFIKNRSRLILFAGLWLLIYFFSSVTVQAQTYCTPTIPDGCSITGTWPNGHWISHVQLGTINDYPLNANCTVYDHTNLTTDITAGASTAMTVETGGYVGIAIYVDFNNDGDFDDAGEFLYGNYIGNATSTYNFNITIPLSVPQGTYRMRVLGIWAGGIGAGDACDVFTSWYSGGNGFGNFYDYILNVIQPCPTITGSTATPAVVCYGGSSLLSASASITGSAYYWYASATGGTAIDSGNTFQTPSLTHNTTYYVSAKYNGCASDPRTAINIDVQPALPVPNVSPADTLLCSGTVATLKAVKGTAFDTVTIGAGTNGDVVAPVNGTKTYSNTQLIYTQAEMGSIGSFPRKITGISFYKNSGAANTGIGNVQIYMSYISGSQVGTTLPNITAYTLVYNGTWPNSVGANNWIDIPLATPFPGPGAGLNQNLSIVIIRENQPSSFINAPRFAYTDMTSAGVYRCGYNSGNTVLTTALTQTYNRPNLKLSYSFQPDLSWTPFSGLFKDYALGNPLNVTDTNSTVYTNVSGTYHVSAHWQGCSSVSDSSVITILPPIPTDILDTTVCNGEGVVFNGQGYTQSITLTDTFQSVHGCDSVVGLHLTVLPGAVSVTDTAEGCWSLTHNGQSYTSSTLLSDT